MENVVRGGYVKLREYRPDRLFLTKYLFFTGKGGVGKTSTACATAINLADAGKKVMLVSTDPASNLQDVFAMDLTNKGKDIPEVPGLTVANFDPVSAAFDYKESVVGPYRGKLPEAVIANMEEQLSGSCTVEIAAFNEFSTFLTNTEIAQKYDHIIFDTAPTGHTLRMLELPSAWSNFMDESEHGASCLGQLSGLADKRAIYGKAVDTLTNSDKTTLILVTRPEEAPIVETARASMELQQIGITNQLLIINGLLDNPTDKISNQICAKQQKAIESLPNELTLFELYKITLKPFNITGIKNLRNLLRTDSLHLLLEKKQCLNYPKIQVIIEDIFQSNKKVIFTMGKGGVGKTTMAAALAIGLAEKGKKVHLATTDPAAHLENIVQTSKNMIVSHIDEESELVAYKEEVLSKARQTMAPEDIAYVEEDLRSPCTQEIAVFRAFAELVDDTESDIVIVDTAPTGHTLLLLDSTQSYHKEMEQSSGDIPNSVRNLLPKLQNRDETEVVIVTLPETTPVYESIRLQEDLMRAGIYQKWWLINNSMLASETTNPMLIARANNELNWIEKVKELSNNNFALVEWKTEELKGEQLHTILV